MGSSESDHSVSEAALRVGAALPDPPFELMTEAGPDGFDIQLTRSIAARLGRSWKLIRYQGDDFNGIFAGLESGAYDCIASGATITDERRKLADFCTPYIFSGQSLVVDARRHPDLRSTQDLRGLVIGVQSGNTSQPVADGLVAAGNAASVRVYAYGDIGKALDDLSTGGCDAFMKLEPVMRWLLRGRPKLKIVQTGVTQEALGICVRRGDATLQQAINRAQLELLSTGALKRLTEQWLGDGARLFPGQA